MFTLALALAKNTRSKQKSSKFVATKATVAAPMINPTLVIFYCDCSLLKALLFILDFIFKGSDLLTR